MTRDFRTNIGLEFYVDEVLEFSFNGDYYAFYQPEYDHLVIRAKNENQTVFRYNEASTILLDGVAFVDIQNQLNDIFDSLSGGGGPASGLTTANNGLSVNPSGNAQLGGAGSDLIQNTDIETLDFRFKIEGNDPGFGFNQGLSINANINQAQLFSTTQNSIIGWDSGLNRLQIQSGSLSGITLTNDGTNNLFMDPTGFTLQYNTPININFNDGAGKVSNLVIDNVETVLNYQDTATGAISQHSLNTSLWTASYQLTNITRIQLDDNAAQLAFQNGSTSNLSTILVQDTDITLSHTDGVSTASVRVDYSNGLKLTSPTDFFIEIPSTPNPVGSVLTLLDNSNGKCGWQQLANPTGDSMLIQASDPEILSLNSPNNLIATIGPSSFDLPDISTLAVGATKSFTCYKSVAVGNVTLNCTAGATCEGRFGGLFFSGTGGFVLTSQGQAVTLTAIGGSNVWFVSNSNI